ncbi:MAG: hypothetical protein JKX76_05030 [Colwellia sp.]|nr:hypothetical protein [Colwellia sp.]
MPLILAKYYYPLNASMAARNVLEALKVMLFQLAQMFTIDICAHTVMHNHL